MKLVYKFMSVLVCASIALVSWFALMFSSTRADDLLETAFKQSKYFDYTINIGTDRASVGKAFLRDGYTIQAWSSNGNFSITGSSSDPIIIRVVKWFLEIVIILGVPLLIFGGIKYITASWDEWAQKSARSFMINVVIGIILALSSLAIVTLASSLLNDSRLGQDLSQNVPK